jgi:LacI family transcriptional regulator
VSGGRKRITLKDVARAAGVSLMTASNALRNNPATAEATRKRVKAVAAELGYRPDPVLSALMAYRNQVQTDRMQGVLAVIIDKHQEEWEKSQFNSRVAEGLRSRAGELGYDVQFFQLGQEGMNPKRMTSVLRNRGVRGLVVMPPSVHGTSLEMGWENFCAVSVGRSLKWPALDFVSANQYGSGQRIMLEMWQRGYRRVGFVSPAQIDVGVGRRFLAAYFASQQERHGTPQVIPPLLSRGDQSRVVADWYERYKPDAILSDEAGLLGILDHLQIRVPDTVGLAVTRILVEDSVISGILPRLEAIGSKAVDFLHTKIIVGDTGIPKERTGAVIDGSWHEGTTLPKR